MILIKLASGDFRLSIGESFARGFIFQEQIDIQILPWKLIANGNNKDSKALLWLCLSFL